MCMSRKRRYDKITYESAKVEWSGLEIIFEDEPRCDRNGVRNVKRYNAQAEYCVGG